MADIGYIERHRDHRLTGQTSLFSFKDLKVDYICMKHNGQTRSTLFGNFEQGMAHIANNRIDYTGLFYEKESHIRIMPLKFTLAITLRSGGEWLDKLQARELSEFNKASRFTISQGVDVLHDITLPVESLMLTYNGSTYLCSNPSGKLQLVKTKDIGIENNLWFKGRFDNDEFFEINIYSKPVVNEKAQP